MKRAKRLALSLTCFEFCSSAAFVCTFLCPSAAASVAVKSVYLDTTVHLAFRQVFLGERSLPWRAWQVEVVAKEEPESPATNVAVRDFDLGVPNIAMKLLQTVFLSLGKLGWHWKPPWSHLASVTTTVPVWWSSQQRWGDDGQRRLTLSWEHLREVQRGRSHVCCANGSNKHGLSLLVAVSLLDMMGT